MGAFLIWLAIALGCSAIIWLVVVLEARRDPRECAICGDPVEPGQRHCEDCYSALAW